MRYFLCIGLFGAVLMVQSAFAQSFTLPGSLDEVVGSPTSVAASREDTLLDIARRYDIGQEEILMANPSVDRWLPEDGAKVTLPTAYILPRAERKGLVLNVPEMRLYYYPPRTFGEPGLVQTYPVSIGRMDWATPLGITRIVEKIKDPSWRPPDSITAERAADGEKLPNVVPPGPDNPLGKFALRLGLPGYLIHSTNKPYGVGMRVTHGCVRMYPEDMESLYPLISVGTQVTIVNQPIKLGWLGDVLYIEIHAPLEEEKAERGLKERVLDLLKAESEIRRLVLDDSALAKALKLHNGIPMPIGRAKTPATATNP
ncbi:MAG: L,D-transpeptidase family protein [Polyangiales bacterium]